MESDNNYKIQAFVCDPVVKDGISKYIMYTIRGEDSKGPFDLMRRFSDFDHLRQILLKRWPACYIPPLPSKKTVGNMDNAFVEDRRYQLEVFIQKVALAPHLWNSDEFQIFIRNPNNDIEKAFKQLQPQGNQEVIEKYQNNFKYLNGKEINSSVEFKIDNFNNYLKKINSMLENYKEIAKNVKTSKDSEGENFVNFLSFLLPEYEKNCLIEYIGNEQKFIFSNQNDQQLISFIQQIKELNNRNEFKTLYELIRQESKEVNAFLEALEGRTQYRQTREKLENKLKDLKVEQQKCMAGKSSFKSMFSKKTKEENVQEIQNDIDKTDNELKQISFICDIMTVILGYEEIDKFKSEKEQSFFQTIRRIAQYEIEFTKLKTQLWDYILHNLSQYQY